MNELIVVADLGCLKVFKATCEAVDTTPKLELIETFRTPAHEKISELLTDEAGRFPGGVRTIRSLRTYGERHDLELELHKRSLKQLSHRINQLVRENKDCRNWVLVAGKQINEKLLESLDPGVKSRLRANLPEDLTHLSEGDLLHHFRQKNMALKCTSRLVFPK